MDDRPVRPAAGRHTLESGVIHVNGAWLAIGCTVLVSFVALVTWIKGRRIPAEQGHVSEQWLSEQRLAQTQDANR